MALVTVPIWQADVVTGRGWIAVALVIFASWKPSKALVGAYLFGALNILGFRLQSVGIHISNRRAKVSYTPIEFYMKLSFSSSVMLIRVILLLRSEERRVGKV